jgi:prevent-host-death family protein
MRSIGVRELRQNTSRVLRQVREKGEQIEVTYRGRAVARLIPISRPAVGRRDSAGVWSDLDKLAAEIGARWRGASGAREAVREGRRRL